MSTLYAEDIILTCLNVVGAFHTTNTLMAIIYDRDDAIPNVDNVAMACHLVVTRAMS
jgi:hypothetical protein